MKYQAFVYFAIFLFIFGAITSEFFIYGSVMSFIYAVILYKREKKEKK